MGFEIGVPGAVIAFLGPLVSAVGRLALPAALLAVLALCVALWVRLRRLTRTLDSLAASVKKALEAQRTPAPPPSPAPRVRYTKRGVPYQWDPVHGSRFVKKKGA
jgi:hypothetical protein